MAFDLVPIEETGTFDLVPMDTPEGVPGRGPNVNDIPTDFVSQYIARPIGRAATTAAAGVASLADPAVMAYNSTAQLAGAPNAQVPLPSETVRRTGEMIFTDAIKPQNIHERIADVGGEMVSAVSAIPQKLTKEAPDIVKAFVGGNPPSGGGGGSKLNPFRIDEQAAKELQEQGIDVSTATAGAKNAKDVMQNYLKNTFIGSGKLDKAKARVTTQLEGAYEDVLAAVGKPDDAVGAGQQIKKGLEVANRAFRARAETMYRDVDGLIPESTPVKAANALEALKGKRSSLTGTAIDKTLRSVDGEADKAAEELFQAIEGMAGQGQLTYGVLRDLRSNIRQKMKSTAFGDKLDGVYKSLYSALSRDIREAAGGVSREAIAKVREADQFYFKGISDLKALDKRYGGQKLEQDIFNALSGNASIRKGGQRIEMLMDSMPSNARRIVAASITDKMAKNAAGEFDPLALARNVQNMDERAFRSLYKGMGMRKDDITKLARNIERVKPLLEQSPPTGIRMTGTGGDLLAAGGIMAGVMSPYALVLGAGKFTADALLSHLLTRPKSIKALNLAAEVNDPELTRKTVRMFATKINDPELRRSVAETAKKQKKASTGE